VITGRFADLAGGVRENTNFSLLTGLQGTTAQNISGRDLVVNPDGTFTITVSAEPGAPGQNHLQLTSDSTLIATRNTLSDWTNQEPMTLSIQRIGGPPNSLFSQFGGFALPVIGPLVVNTPLLTTLVSLIPPLADPPPLLRGVVAAAVMLLGIQREAQYIAVATTDPTTGARIQPNVLTNPTRNAEFLATQLPAGRVLPAGRRSGAGAHHRSGRRDLLRGSGDQRLDHHRRLLEPADQPEQRAGQAH
jgi:hypothetical protein